MIEILKNNLLIIFSFFLFYLINCEDFPPKPDGGDIERMTNELNRLEREHSDKENDLEIYKVIITVLIGIMIFFLIIIIALAMYEIINCCSKRKKEFIRRNILSQNYEISRNSNKLSKNSSSGGEEKVSKNKSSNSFNSSNVLAKDEFNNSSNIAIQKSNLQESNYSRERLNSGYEAPLVENIVFENNSIANNNNNNNNEEKLLTNNGNEDEKTYNNDSKNPFVN